MVATDLTTLNALKNYLAIPLATTTSDAILQAMITQVSSAIRSDIGRDLVPVGTHNVNRDGNDKNAMFMSAYPIISIQSLTLNGVSVAAAPQPNTGGCPVGYLFESDVGLIELQGRCFPKGLRNINIQFTAGYASTDAAIAIPTTPFQLVPLQPQGNWNSDVSVTINGVTAVKVASAPITGQYTITVNATTGQPLYTFAAADAGKLAVLQYGYVPADLENACLEWAALKMKQKDTVGIDSKGMAGETVRYTKDAMPESIDAVLDPYRRMVPLL